MNHTLKQTESGYEFALADRQIVYLGATAEEAIGAALTGVCELGRDGAVDPAQPGANGLGRLNHAMAVSTEALSFWLKLTSAENEQTRATARAKVAAIATAIAALARVPD